MPAIAKEVTTTNGAKTTAIATPGRQVRGIERGDTEDLVLPRVLLMQKLSKFVEDGAKPGTFVNSLTRKQVVDTTFIPVIFTKYWDILKKEGKTFVFDKRVTDKNDPALVGRKFFGDAEGKADVNTVIAFISFVEGKPAIIPFAKSSYRTGKNLYSHIFNSGKDAFASKYQLTTRTDTKEGNTFFIADYTYVGDTTEQEYALAEQFYNAWAKKVDNVTTVGATGDAIETEGEPVPF